MCHISYKQALHQFANIVAYTFVVLWATSLHEASAQTSRFTTGTIKVPGSPADDYAQIQLPGYRHKENISSRNLGCCVFRSIDHAARWANVKSLIGLPEWMVKEGIPGGGYPEKVDQIIKRKCGDSAPNYVQFTGLRDLKLIKLALDRGYMPCVTYSGRDTRYRFPIAHMVNAIGYSNGQIGILDNNFVGNNAYYWMSEADFLDRWDGWLLVLVEPGPPPPPTNNAEGVYGGRYSSNLLEGNNDRESFFGWSAVFDSGTNKNYWLWSKRTTDVALVNRLADTTIDAPVGSLQPTNVPQDWRLNGVETNKVGNESRKACYGAYAATFVQEYDLYAAGAQDELKEQNKYHLSIIGNGSEVDELAGSIRDDLKNSVQIHTYQFKDPDAKWAVVDTKLAEPTSPINIVLQAPADPRSGRALVLLRQNQSVSKDTLVRSIKKLTHDVVEAPVREPDPHYDPSKDPRTDSADTQFKVTVTLSTIVLSIINIIIGIIAKRFNAAGAIKADEEPVQVAV